MGEHIRIQHHHESRNVLHVSQRKNVMKRDFILRTQSVVSSALDYINGLELNEDKPLWQISIQPFKKARSNKQNRLYWDWMTLVSAETGYTKLESHEAWAMTATLLSSTELSAIRNAATFSGK